MARQLMIPAADTRLYTVDTPGGSPPLLFLSGGFGTVRNWNPVIQRLAGEHRTVRFDAAARGKSAPSADYSVQAAVDDIGRVIDATGIERPILVGWSYGATIAVRYAAGALQRAGDGARRRRVPDRHAGRGRQGEGPSPVPPAGLDHAHPRRAGPLGADVARRIRRRRDRDGRGQRRLSADFAALECPAVFVVGTGAHSGATEDEMRTVRAAVAGAEATNGRVSVFATTPHKHTQILTKAPDTVAARSRMSSGSRRDRGASASPDVTAKAVVTQREGRRRGSRTRPRDPHEQVPRTERSVLVDGHPQLELGLGPHLQRRDPDPGGVQRAMPMPALPAGNRSPSR